MLEIKHIELSDANRFIALYHRHHPPVTGHRFSLAAYQNGLCVGVAIVGRPVARHIDHKQVVEITRLCTDGTPNACSFLYGGCRRAAKALGYSKIITYILETESGTSLYAAGWRYEYTTTGGSWNSKSRPRSERFPTTPKKLFSVDLIFDSPGGGKQISASCEKCSGCGVSRKKFPVQRGD